MKKDEIEQALDGKTGSEEETKETGQEENEQKKEPGEILRELCRGTLKLIQPFRAHSDDVLAVPFDFCDLTGSEMMDALDSAPGKGAFDLSNKQAMALFAATAAKCAPMVQDGNRMTKMYDARDVISRMSAADSVMAVQIAKLFYRASGQAGSNNISKE